MITRLQRRFRYEVARHTRDRDRYSAAIAAASERAVAYCAGFMPELNLAASTSTGADATDYYLLHRYVMVHRPPLVVEFGSGKTTLVLADALSKTGGHLVTYEAVPEYYEDVCRIIPERLQTTVTTVCAAREITEFRGLWGVRYAETPPEGASFFFIDGPTETVDGRKGACLDLLFYLQLYPSTWITALIDRKFSSQEAYQSVLPAGSVAYDPIFDVGVIEGACGQLLTERRDPLYIRRCSVIDTLRL